MVIDAVPEIAGLSGANLMAVEHAELVVALYAAATALDENGLYQEASTARAVLQGMAIRAVH
jgi:cobalamin biosynthesis protein CbiG